MIIEVAVENFTESLTAFKKGASRLELCENLALGGTTPSYGAIKMCVQKLPIPTFVMIRPRGGNFVYNENEIQVMLADMENCKNLGVKGVVFGCLTQDNKIDYSAMEKLIKNCENMEIICHRAYDELKDSYLEVEPLAKIGVNRILSAGGTTTFFDGLPNLQKTLQQCEKHGVALTAAGKITQENLAQAIALLPNVSAIHGRAIIGDIN